MKNIRHTIIILLFTGVVWPLAEGCRKDNATATTCNRLDKSSTYSESDKLREYSYEYNGMGPSKRYPAP